MASGVRDSQIPDLVFENGADYKQYPGKTDSKNLFDDKGIVGVKTRQIVFMPTVAGNIVLPRMEIPWFDVKTGKMKKAVLPSRTIIVTAEAGEVTAALPSASVQTSSQAKSDQSVSTVSSGAKEESEFAKAFSEPLENTDEQRAAQSFWEKYVRQPPLRLFLAGILSGGSAVLVLWLLVHFLIFNKKKEKLLPERQKKDDSDALKQLKEACRSGAAEKTKQALLNWGHLHWPENPPLTLSELAKRLHSPALEEEADSLNRALYAGNPDEWNGEDFWLAFKLAQTDEKKTSESEKIPVPPLYPN
jgi:hypothetical protein